MNTDEIRQALTGILKRIAPESDPATLGPDDNIRKKLDIDSFDALTFFVRIHEELGVTVPESDYGQLHTLSQILRYLESRVA